MCKFAERTDDDRGAGAVERCLDKVLYLDADATALHQRISRTPLDIALKSNAYDRDGNSTAGSTLPAGITPTTSDGGDAVWAALGRGALSPSRPTCHMVTCW